jgi:hypothetical protein
MPASPVPIFSIATDQYPCPVCAFIAAHIGFARHARLINPGDRFVESRKPDGSIERVHDFCWEKEHA